LAQRSGLRKALLGANANGRQDEPAARQYFWRLKA